MNPFRITFDRVPLSFPRLAHVGAELRTYLVRHAFSQSVLGAASMVDLAAEKRLTVWLSNSFLLADVAEEAQKTDLLSTEMRDQNAPKASAACLELLQLGLLDSWV